MISLNTGRAVCDDLGVWGAFSPFFLLLVLVLRDSFLQFLYRLGLTLKCNTRFDETLTGNVPAAFAIVILQLDDGIE